MSSRSLVVAALCLLMALLSIATAQSQDTSQQQQSHQQRLEQYDTSRLGQHTTGEHISGRRFKRMYALCPPEFFRVGNVCYYISQTQLNWLDASFECKDRNSKLAEPLEFEDKNLRKYLQKIGAKNYIWIGGNYNWRTNKWQWGYNGKSVGYQSFSQMIPGSSQDLKYHCALLSPELRFRWTAKLCTEKLNFICQHKMPLVNGHSRAKVYTRWNGTFTGKANEVEVIVADQPRSDLRTYYKIADAMKVNSTKPARKINRMNRIKSYRDYISNDVIHRPVVEYASDSSYNSINGNGHGNGNGYRNRNGASRTRFNVDIHGPKRHRKNDVHTDEYRHHRRRTTPTTTTTPVPVTLPTEALQVATEKHQPPQHTQTSKQNLRDRIKERIAQLPPHQRELFNTKHAMTTEKYQDTNQVAKLSHEEKKARREKLRKRLAQLTPEERELFYAERSKRKQSKKVLSKNETIP